MASLGYSEALRVIGESLEALGINALELEKHGQDFIVHVTAGKPAAEQSFIKKSVKDFGDLAIPKTVRLATVILYALRHFPAGRKPMIATSQRERHTRCAQTRPSPARGRLSSGSKSGARVYYFHV